MEALGTAVRDTGRVAVAPVWTHAAQAVIFSIYLLDFRQNFVQIGSRGGHLRLESRTGRHPVAFSRETIVQEGSDGTDPAPG